MQKIMAYFFSHVKNSFLMIISILGYAIIIWMMFALLYFVRKRKYGIKVKNILLLGLLSINISFILAMTLFGRSKGVEFMVQFSLFASYIEVFTERDVELLLQIIMNIVMYIPFGFLLPLCFGVFIKYRYVLIVTFVCSGIVEVIQGITRIGVFETDDILNNVLGTVVGVVFHMFIVKRWIRDSKNKMEVAR